MAPHAPPASPDLALLRSKLAQECAHICPLAVFHEAKSRQADVDAGAVELGCGGEARGEYGVVGRMEGMGERRGEGE